jgi:phage baseplate assembly protein V
MSNGLIDTAAQTDVTADRRIYGISPACVVDNTDPTAQGRVQVRLSWLPDVEPWARVAVPMAGHGMGFFFIPQIGDEVLVAFFQGDVRQPYVIGSLWNGSDPPPSQDPVTRRIIRTPSGHEVLFDEEAQTVAIQTASQQTITLGSDKIEIETQVCGDVKATVKLDTQGEVSIVSSSSIKLEAPEITVNGKVVEIKGSTSAKLGGGQACEIKAGTVNIN